MTLKPRCEKVETAKGVPLTVTGVAQVKVMNSPEFLQTLEGHLRAILGTMTVEEIYRDREQFALKVREVASPDVGKMGIEILSFTSKDVFDNVNYLGSLGKTQTEIVKRDAKIGIAEANRDAGIKEAECEKAAEDVKFQTDTKIEDDKRAFKLKQANFIKEVNTAQAEAELAYELEEAKLQQYPNRTNQSSSCRKEKTN